MMAYCSFLIRSEAEPNGIIDSAQAVASTGDSLSEIVSRPLRQRAIDVEVILCAKVNFSIGHDGKGELHGWIS